MAKKIIFNTTCGLLAGFIYGLNSKLFGLINSVLFFSILGLLYGHIAIVIDLLTKKFYKPLKVITKPLIKAAIVRCGLLIIFRMMEKISLRRFGNTHELFYIIFQYKESDSLGPCLFNVFFPLLLGTLVYIINFSSELGLIIYIKSLFLRKLRRIGYILIPIGILGCIFIRFIRPLPYMPFLFRILADGTLIFVCFVIIGFLSLVFGILGEIPWLKHLLHNLKVKKDRKR